MNCLVPGSKLYLFKASDNNEAQHWRSDGHKCYKLVSLKKNPIERSASATAADDDDVSQ